MAERIVSPGVFTNENDLSFLPQGIGEIGAAIIGPTEKGPAFWPTQVTSNNDFDNIIDSLINYILITKDNNLETYMQDSSNSLSSLYERAYGAILNIKCLFLAETGGESIKGNAELLDKLGKETNLPNSISLSTKLHSSGNRNV